MIKLTLELLSPIRNRLAANSPGFVKTFRWFILAAGVAALADYLSTVHFMLLGGVDDEVHPGIRAAAVAFGPYIGPLIGKLAQLAAIALIAVYVRSLARYLFFAVTMMYAWAAWYNVWGYELYTPWLLTLIS